jgi:hypothetical protein
MIWFLGRDFARSGHALPTLEQLNPNLFEAFDDGRSFH